MTFVAVVAVVAVLAGAAVIYNSEHTHADASIKSFPDALWWSVGAITTVGTNGDPTTGTGRVVAAVMFILGVALVGIFTAALATWFIASNDDKAEAASPELARELAEIRAELSALRSLLGQTATGGTNPVIDTTPTSMDGRTDSVVH